MDVTFYDTETNLPVLFFDTLKMSNIENTAEEFILKGGRGNPPILSWDFNREANLTMQDALLSPKSFELLSGNAVTIDEAGTPIHMRQSTVYETVEGETLNKGWMFPLKGATGTGEITLGFEPVEAVADIIVYKIDEDGGTPIPVTAKTGKVITAAASADEHVVVYYTYLKQGAEMYTITSDAFPGTYKIVGDTVVRNAKTGKDEGFQVVIQKAKLKPGFTMTFQAEGKRYCPFVQ